MKHDEVQVGRRVVFVPKHAHGDRNHYDCEHGVVYGKNEQTVFVRYGGNTQAQATDAEDLVYDR